MTSLLAMRGSWSDEQLDEPLAQSPPRLSARRLAAELLDLMNLASMRSIRAVRVSAAPARAEDMQSQRQIAAHHDDDDNSEISAEEEEELAVTFDDEVDAPHPRDERHWFTRHEERAFEHARQFDRLAPRCRHAESRRRSQKRAPASPRRPWQPAAAPSARLAAETNAVQIADNETVIMPRPTPVPSSSASAEDANVQRAIAESRRQAADASRLVDAEFARACGLTPAQLAAMMTRELSANDYELLLALDNAVAAKTIKKVDDVLAAVAPGSVAADDCCMICLDEMAGCPLADLAALPCKHIFHRKCIGDHLGKFSRRCPIDNLSLEK